MLHLILQLIYCVKPDFRFNIIIKFISYKIKYVSSTYDFLLKITVFDFFSFFEVLQKKKGFYDSFVNFT